MEANSLFCHLSTELISEMILDAKDSVCYAGPGIQKQSAEAIAKVVERVGHEMLTVCLDFDEKVMRMGYGSIDAVKLLTDSGIKVNHVPGLRNALIIVDGKGYTYTPTALLLEGEPCEGSASNALRMSRDQIAEAMARLSPTAKIIAIAQAPTPKEKTRIADLPVELAPVSVSEEQIKQVEDALKVAPPVQFDLARQVRVFASYIQYIELSLTGAAIQRKRLSLPSELQQLGVDNEIQNRIHTTFDLISSDNALSSKPLEMKMKKIRDDLTRSIGGGHGRVVLKSAKPQLEKDIASLRQDLAEHQKKIEQGLAKHIEDSKNEVVKYYLPILNKRIENGDAPRKLIGQSLCTPPSDDDIANWIRGELDCVFPEAESLIRKMELKVIFKDVTYESLNQNDFKRRIENVFSNIDWDELYDEYHAMGESNKDE